MALASGRYIPVQLAQGLTAFEHFQNLAACAAQERTGLVVLFKLEAVLCVIRYMMLGMGKVACISGR